MHLTEDLEDHKLEINAEYHEHIREIFLSLALEGLREVIAKETSPYLRFNSKILMLQIKIEVRLIQK